MHKAPKRPDPDTDVKLVPRASYRRESKLSTYLWTPENMITIDSASFEIRMHLFSRGYCTEIPLYCSKEKLVRGSPAIYVTYKFAQGL